MSDRTVALIGFALLAVLVALFLSAGSIVRDDFQNEAARETAQAEEGRR